MASGVSRPEASRRRQDRHPFGHFHPVFLHHRPQSEGQEYHRHGSELREFPQLSIRHDLPAVPSDRILGGASAIRFRRLERRSQRIGIVRLPPALHQLLQLVGTRGLPSGLDSHAAHRHRPLQNHGRQRQHAARQEPDAAVGRRPAALQTVRPADGGHHRHRELPFRPTPQQPPFLGCRQDLRRMGIAEKQHLRPFAHRQLHGQPLHQIRLLHDCQQGV